VRPRAAGAARRHPHLYTVDADGTTREFEPARPARHARGTATRTTARVSVVIPALNEAKNLPHVLPFIPVGVHEVILVDGRSSDGTIDVARALLPGIRIVRELRPGKGAALCAGFRAAEGEIIVALDADGSTDPMEIPRFVEALLGGADFAKGSRFLANGGSTDISRLRAFGNLGFVALVRVLFGGRYTDLCYGYNAFWKSVLPTLDLDGAGFEIETMMNVRALRAGLRITEVPSFERSRIHGVSNLRTFRDGWQVLLTILRERLPARPSSMSWHPTPNANDADGDAIGSAPWPRLVPVMDQLLAADADEIRAPMEA
jgi:glycosyltransferase involved in cell wall biosynthesis